MMEPGTPPLDSRAKIAFLALMVSQMAHSIEEYAFRLYEVLAPARYVSALISDDLGRGFAIGNLIVVAAGIISYVAIVRRDRGSARAVAWFWSLLELFNGIGHFLFAAAAGGYVPGVATAPLLLACSAYLLSNLASTPELPIDGGRQSARGGVQDRSG